MVQMTLNTIMNNVEKHWQASSYWTGQQVEQPLADRVRSLSRIAKFLEEKKTDYMISSLALAGACVITTFCAISSSVLLSTIALVTSAALAIFTWDHSNTYSAMNNLYNIVVEFSDTLQAHGDEPQWSTSHGQRRRWSQDLDYAKWCASNMFIQSNPMNQKFRDPGLQNLLPLIAV